MSHNYASAHLEWIRLAEEAVENQDYESAARLFRHVTIYFGISNEVSNQREFAVKAGECYLHAAKKAEDEGNPLRAVLLCIKAVDSFKEGKSEDSAEFCDSLIRKNYLSVTKTDFRKDEENAHDLKGVGDYFVKNGDCERAIECYRIAAEKASNQNKLALSGGLYRDIGDCYRNMNDLENAARSYTKAADMYLACQEYFEAVWHYCVSGFLLVYVGRREEASIMAGIASSACQEGGIHVLLNDLSEVCRLLSEGSVNDAEQLWVRIRMKFKRSYANLVDSCFQALREKMTQRT